MSFTAIFAQVLCSFIYFSDNTPSLTLFRMGFFGAAQGRGRLKGLPFRKIGHMYPAMMKLGTVIPYLKKIPKLYESRGTPLEFC